MNINDKIEYIRKQKGITKTHISTVCGKSPSWYTGICKGKKKILAEDLPLIASALGVEVDIFFNKNLSDTLKNEKEAI